MAKYLVWLFWAYVALKLIHLMLGRGSGSDGGPLTIRERVVGGEPILFAVAFLLSVPVPMWISGQLHRGYAQGFQRATDCYGRFAAGSALPGIRNEFDRYRLYQGVDGAESLAQRAGQLLDLKHDVVTAVLANKTHLFARRYAALTRAGEPRQVIEQEEAVRHCFKTLQDIQLSPPWL